MPKRWLYLAIGISFVVALAVFQNCEMAPYQRSPWDYDDDDFSSVEPTPIPTPGPNDVRYVLGGWACGSKDLLIHAQMSFNVRSIFLDVTPNEIRQLTNYYTGCTRFQSFSYSYPNSSTLSITHGPTQCVNCSPMQCYNVGTPNPPITVNYGVSQSASALVLKRVLTSVEVNDPASVYKLAGCLNGEIETLTYVRQ